MNRNTTESHRELLHLCSLVRRLSHDKAFDQCREAIVGAMSKHPDAPEPHNLFGVLLEKEGDHVSAVKHFRAASALDPAYIPARHNLIRFSSFRPIEQCAFDESDCRPAADKGEGAEIVGRAWE